MQKFNTSMDDFEYLLKQRDNNINGNIKDFIIETERIEPLQANKSASLEDFIVMLSNITSKALQYLKVNFIPDEGARLLKDQKETMNSPYILYEVVSRQPVTELKPRARQEIVEDIDDTVNSRQGVVWGQKFISIVQFNILACDYKTCNKVMELFEELIFKYTAYFKRNGVAEILFKNQLTDQNLDFYRQSLSVRSLQYQIITEKLFVQFKSNISGINLE